ncbi:probable peptidyl-prolyl cis-trans isomerase transmembrane protein [gamma proteobacterium NOR5-3]|nr:probable peptidyl-prolyl cis-trans isomerase transmembrane protein [gamma proteobacterium NOR5-3]
MILAMMFCTIAQPTLGADPSSDVIVIKDGELEITEQEMQYALKLVPESVRKLAQDDPGTRYELLTEIVLPRKKAALASAFNPSQDEYWELRFAEIAARQKIISTKLLAEYPVPDFKALALERYTLQPEKYGLVPEERKGSHILFRSPPGLDREPLREKATNVLAELRSGAVTFTEAVELYSEDPGTAKKGGLLDRWITYGDPSISPPFSEALFAVDQPGLYSEVTDTQFGLHIIRLEAIKPSRIQEFDEVKSKVLTEIVKEYRTLAQQEINSRFLISEDAEIDVEALDRLFAQPTQ